MKGKQQAIKSAEISASQRAALAANGIPLYGGTAADIGLDTANKTKMDELAIRFNADTKSWETNQQARDFNWQSQNQAQQYRYAGQNAKRAGKANAFSTILSTAASTGMSAWNMGLFSPKTPTFLGSGTTSYGIKVPSRLAFR